MQFIDSHAHVTSDRIFGDIERLIERARLAGVQAIINICTDKQTLERGLVLARNHPWVYNAGATTPHDVEREGESAFPFFEEQAQLGNLIAIGETGLDYFYEHSPKELQKYFLKRYLSLALACQLPVIIHCREAFADLFEILDTDYMVEQKHAPGVLHCFTGTLKEAEEVLARNWFLSLSGIITFKKSEELRKVAKQVPLDQLLIETDTPYLAPQSRRGLTNEPSFLPEIIHAIAAVKEITPEEVAYVTTNNACRLFGFDSKVRTY